MSTNNTKENAPKYQKGNNLDYTPVTYDPQYILMVLLKIILSAAASGIRE